MPVVAVYPEPGAPVHPVAGHGFEPKSKRPEAAVRYRLVHSVVANRERSTADFVGAVWVIYPHSFACVTGERLPGHREEAGRDGIPDSRDAEC